MKKVKFLLAVIVSFVASTQVSATHLRGGYIQFKSLDNNNVSFEVTVFLISDKESDVDVGEGEISFGDGNIFNLKEKATDIVITPLNQGSLLYAYKTNHTYSAPGKYIISYNEANRNLGVKNMFSSVNTPMHFESEVLIDPFLGMNDSPIGNDIHYLKALTGIKMLYNAVFSDKEGDSLSYHLVVPKQANNMEVMNYQLPNSSDFYSSDYSISNEGKNGPPDFSISPFDGNLTWDAPGLTGEYSIALKIKEWRKVNNEIFNISSTTYDVQILVEENVSNLVRPTTTIPNSQCYNGNLDETFEVISNNKLIKVELFTDAINAALDNVPFDEFVFESDFSNEDFNVQYTLNEDQATQQYHQTVLKVSQMTLDGSIYSWSQGFVFGFGCETIERVITSTQQNVPLSLYSIYANGQLSLTTSSKLNDRGSINLYDSSGKLVFIANQKFMNGQMSLKIPRLENGIYIMGVRSTSFFYRDKLLIKD